VQYIWGWKSRPGRAQWLPRLLTLSIHHSEKLKEQKVGDLGGEKVEFSLEKDE